MMKKTDKLSLFRKLQTYIPFILLSINYLTIILSFRSSPFSHLLNDHDSSMFLYFGKAMNAGLTPYINMFDHKGIVLFWIQQLGTLIGGENYSLGIWIVECIFYLLTLHYLYRTCMLITKNKYTSSLAILLTTGPSLITFSGGNLSEEYALTFISIALYYFTNIILLNNNKSYYLIIIGIMGGLTFFIRPNMIALWVVFCLYFLLNYLINKKYKLLFKTVSSIFIGGIFVCLLVYTYSIFMGNLAEMIYQTFTLNVQYSSGSTLSDKVTAARSFLEFSSRIGIIPFICFFLFYIIVNNIKSINFNYCMCIAVYTIINFATVVISGRPYSHYFTTMLPSIVIVTVIGLTWLITLTNLKSKKILILLTVVFIPASYTYLAVRDSLKPVLVTTPNQVVESLTVSQANYIKNHTNKNDSIYVHNLDANIYLISNRFSNSKFFVLPAIDYNQFENLRTDFQNSLKKNPPKYVIINKQTYEQSHPTDSLLDKSILDFIKKDYSLVDEFSNSENLMLVKNN